MNIKKDHSIGEGTGAVAGAIAGAAVGSVAGPVGTLVGAVAGGALGAKGGGAVAGTPGDAVVPGHPDRRYRGLAGDPRPRNGQVVREQDVAEKHRPPNARRRPNGGAVSTTVPLGSTIVMESMVR